MLHSLVHFILAAGLLLSSCLPSFPSNGLPSGGHPQAMPPHPRLEDRISGGQVVLPAYMTDPSIARHLGIDAAGRSPAGETPGRAPLTGSIRALAVLVDFSDQASTVNASFYDSLLFASPVPGRGSVRDYFAEISYGSIDIVTFNLPSSLGWKRAPQTMAYYTDNKYCLDGVYPRNCQKLAEDVVDAVNGVVDFARYDNDGDGYTEPILLIHAGQGAEYSSSTAHIWSHSWGLKNARNYDGKTISSYVIMPEYWSTVSALTSDMTIGVFAHEMGHGFWDLPDLYDRDYSSQGVGRWSLMAGGSWNGPAGLGESPAWPDAWSRVQMGIATSVPVTSSVTGQVFPRVYDQPGSVFKVASLALEDQEYFLIENRQQVSGSYDQYLPGSGLLVWHVDEAMNVYSKQNDYECTSQWNYQCSDTSHYLVALMQADGLRELENNGDSGDGGDPFPGTANKRNWTTGTSPDSYSWYGSTAVDSCIGLTSISSSADTMTANLQACGVPGALSASPLSDTQINLSWTDASSTETGFAIERSPGGTGSWTTLTTTAANTTSYADTGLTCATPYSYRVRAVGRSYSAYSATTSTETLSCGPAAPSGLTAAAASQTQINLSWTDNSNNETSFKVERSPDGASGWSEIAAVGAGVTAYANTGLSCGATYYYRVRAHNAGGYSGYTSPASATTAVCPPSAPSGLVATAVSPTQIDLSWTDHSNNETGFRIQRSPHGAGSWSEIATVGAGATAYADTGLACGFSYDYRVAAFNAGGESSFSGPASATTVCSPAAPSGLTATAVSQTQINLSWTNNDDDETSFRIERSPDGESGWAEIGKTGNGVTVYSNTGLTCGSTYHYRVRAVKGGGSSAYSSPASATTTACPPAAPSGLTAAAASQTQINLSWTDNSNNETGFRIERSPDGESGWSEIAPVGASVTAFADTGLSCGTTYHYRVQAQNAGGYSAYSSPASATTTACSPLTAPSDLAAAAVPGNAIELTWTDNSSQEEGFRVERSSEESGGWSEIVVVGADVTGYTDSGLERGVTYYYRVRAYKAGEYSIYCAAAWAVIPRFTIYLPAVFR